MLGSIFLGDPKARLLSQTSPPSSPHHPPKISPEVALQLRVQWLEAILLGVNDDKKRSKRAQNKTDNDDDDEQVSLTRQAEELQRRLDGIVAESDGLRRFIDTFDKHAHLFTPAFAFSHQNPSTAPSYSSLSPGDFEALLQEMAPDIRSAERDLRDIDTLEKKGVTGAGKLEDYEALQPRLDKILKRHNEDMAKFRALEQRVTTLLEKYATQVDTFSELFVEWSETLAEIEERISKLEKEKADRMKIGLTY